MTNDYLDMIMNTPINSEAVQCVERKYHCVLSNQVKHIVSYDGKDRFNEEFRLLSLGEIIDADEHLGIGFSTLSIIPIIDTFDNDFIAFNTKDNTWIKINIVDECIFDRSENIETLLEMDVE